MGRIALLYAKSKYDQHLEAGFLAQFGDLFDGIICFDDTDNPELWYHEGNVRRLLLKKAYNLGYDWAFCADPDERFSRRLFKQLPRLIRRKKRIAYSLPVREMFSVDKFRVDGKWGEKKKVALVPLFPSNKYQNKKVHSKWKPIGFDVVETNINLYHLKHIQPHMGVLRRQIYEQWDLDGIQADYSYLTNNRGSKFMKLPRIDKGLIAREFPDGVIYPENLKITP